MRLPRHAVIIMVLSACGEDVKVGELENSADGGGEPSSSERDAATDAAGDRDVAEEPPTHTGTEDTLDAGESDAGSMGMGDASAGSAWPPADRGPCNDVAEDRLLRAPDGCNVCCEKNGEVECSDYQSEWNPTSDTPSPVVCTTESEADATGCWYGEFLRPLYDDYSRPEEDCNLWCLVNGDENASDNFACPI